MTMTFPTSNTASSGELLRPDAVYKPGQTESDAEWVALDPCPSCGSRPHDAPDGCHSDGEPRWVFPHCWKCGHRPGKNVAVDIEQMRREFEAFRKFQASSLEESQANQLALIQAQARQGEPS